MEQDVVSAKVSKKCEILEADSSHGANFIGLINSLYKWSTRISNNAITALLKSLSVFFLLIPPSIAVAFAFPQTTNKLRSAVKFQK